ATGGDRELAEFSRKWFGVQGADAEFEKADGRAKILLHLEGSRAAHGADIDSAAAAGNVSVGIGVSGRNRHRLVGRIGERISAGERPNAVDLAALRGPFA